MKTVFMLLVLAISSFASHITLDEVLIKPVQPTLEETVADLFPSTEFMEFEAELVSELTLAKNILRIASAVELPNVKNTAPREASGRDSLARAKTYLASGLEALKMLNSKPDPHYAWDQVENSGKSMAWK